MAFSPFLRKSVSFFLVISLITTFSPVPQTALAEEQAVIEGSATEENQPEPETSSSEDTEVLLENTDDATSEQPPKESKEEENTPEESLGESPEQPEELSTEPEAQPEITDQKFQKRKANLEKRLQNKNLSPEKQEAIALKLQKRENRSEKTAIRNLKKTLKNNQREFKKQLREELRNKNLSKDERKALRKQMKKERKNQFDALKEINEELQKEAEVFTEEIAVSLELTEEEKEELQEALEPSYLFELQEDTTPASFSNDPQLPNQWSIASVLNGSHLSFAQEESGVAENNDPIIIAIIDTGVDMNHEDLQNQFWTDPNCTDDLNEPIAGGCQNGGYDFVDEDTDPSNDDNATHGTSVAGIIGATTNNGTGMASLSQNHVKIMVLKVAEDGFLTSSNITRAIHFAVNNNADIINMSFGGPTASAQMQEAIAEAEANGILITAAAGNYASDNDTTPIYPASYPNQNIISVAALDQNDELASFSNYGATTVDIAAPGVNVLSAVPNNQYETMSGTSFSAPMVAAVLSVLPLSESKQTVSLIDFLIPKAHAEETTPTMTLGEFLNLLFNSVQSLTGLEGKVKGGKVLRFGEGGGQEGGSALPGLKEGVGIDELLDQVVNRSTGLGKTQDFLEEYPGVLKDYIDEKGKLGFHSIEGANYGLGREIKIVMSELKANAITDPNLTNEQIENVFGISDEEIRQMWFGYSNSPIANPPYGPPGVEWNNFTEEDYQTYLEDTSKFSRQIYYFGRYYGMIISGAWEITDPIIFPDESQVTIDQCPTVSIEDKPYDKCTRIFALKVVLAELADSKEQYEHWISFEEGSFFDIYNKFFGFPPRLFEAQPLATSEPQPLSELELDFLKSAYVKSDSCGIASVFDHQSPDYDRNGYNDYTVLFTGKRLASASNVIGYNSYDDHNGLDVHVRDCSRDGGGTDPYADNGKPIYAAADGIVDEVWKENSNHPYGYYVIIRHDINGDGFFDFQTRYGHLKNPPNFIEEDSIKAGDFIGIAGNTGASTGTHLHFHVSRFFYTGNNPDTDEDKNKNESGGSTSSSIIDPFGWWGTEDSLINGDGEVLNDPWEAQNSDLSSLWLFESGDFVDNESLPPACSDGIDNDGDGNIDYSQDTSGDGGCASRYDDNETNANDEPRHDASNSFFSFNYQPYPWQRQEGNAINGSALYTFGSHELGI